MRKQPSSATHLRASGVPIVPPSIAPIPAQRLPPLGTNTCREVQVLNPSTGRYE